MPISLRALRIGLLAVALTSAAGLGLTSSAFGAMRLTGFSATFHDPAGHPVTQAGAHADFTTTFSLATVFDPVAQLDITDEQLKDVVVDLPAGLYGDPQSMPRCSNAAMAAGVGNCPTDSQVGVVALQIGPDPTVPFLGTYTAPVYNLVPEPGAVATLGFTAFGMTEKVEITVRSGGDYGLRATLKNVNEAISLYSTALTLWGVPADPVHDPDRTTYPGFSTPTAAGVERKAFMTMPARCDTVTSTIRVHSWQSPDHWDEASSTNPPLTGCDNLQFRASVKVSPDSTSADKPSGLSVDVSVHQDTSATGVSTPPLRRARVTLPEGVAISPSAATGLTSCSDDDLGLHSEGPPNCSASSSIGTVEITTPVLPEPLEGNVILGTPKAGQLFRLFIVARWHDLIIKLPGVAQPDSKTGQLTATFDDNPQLPFSLLHLHFNGGAHAPLAMPQTCGSKRTTSDLTPWGGPAASSIDSFDITGCGAGFAPSFEAGTTNPRAGAFSSFTMTIRRNDGDQELSGISVNLPPGLLGILTGIPQCPEVQVVAGTCGTSTQLGTTTVESGSGETPLPLTGKVFLGGPYKGAPYSLAIVVRAVAGPFDLGTVVVRAPLNIDAAGGTVSVPADALPTILQGVPLRLRMINVTLDRPGFMFNPTNCTPMSVGATLTSVGGAVATPSSRFQVLGCGELPLSPKFVLTLSGRSQLKKGGHPGVVADLSQRPGQAGLRRVEVTLPSGVSVALPNLSIFCHKADAAVRKCPAMSIVGTASAKTPALPAALSGPVYLVEGSKKDPKTGKDIPTLPRLWLKLEGGGVPLDLWGDTNVVGGRVMTTFPAIPDAPISSFRLKINGGAKGILQTSKAMCSATRATKVAFVGQNGAIVKRTIPAAAACPKRLTRSHSKTIK